MVPKKNIAFISHDFELQGAQKVLLWAVLLLRKEYDVTVMGFKEGALQAEYLKHGIKTKIISFDYDQSEFQEFQWVVMNTLISYKLFSNYGRNFLRKKVILWIHESERDVYEKKLQLKKEVLTSLKQVIFSAHATELMYSDLIRPGSALVVPYPVAPQVSNTITTLIERKKGRAKYHIPQDARLIITVGAVIKRKGQDDLLRAIIPILATNPLVYVAIVGISGLKKEFEDQVRWIANTSGYVERILFIPQTDAVKQWYDIADIFALFAYIESIPVVITEAQFHGLPVVATSVYGIAEQLQHGKTGMLVPAGDVQAFSGAINYLVTHKKESVAIGAQAKKHVQEMDFEKNFLTSFIRALNH